MREITTTLRTPLLVNLGEKEKNHNMKKEAWQGTANSKRNEEMQGGGETKRKLRDTELGSACSVTKQVRCRLESWLQEGLGLWQKPRETSWDRASG